MGFPEFNNIIDLFKRIRQGVPCSWGDHRECALTKFEFNATNVLVLGHGRSKALAAWQGRYGTNHLRHVFRAVTMVDAMMMMMMLEVKRVSERLMVVRVIVGRTVLNLISAYAPQAGRLMPEKEEFFTLFGGDCVGDR